MRIPEDAASHLGPFKGKLPGLLETTKEFSGEAGAASIVVLRTICCSGVSMHDCALMARHAMLKYL
jgi:hypothetical protein